MILDTKAISAIGVGQPEIVRIIASLSGLYVPSIVIGEYRYGLLGSSQQLKTTEWFQGFLSTTIVLDVTHETAFHYAAIFRDLKVAGTPIPVNDVWIAAIARQHQLQLLTRDTHFSKVPGVDCVTW